MIRLDRMSTNSEEDLPASMQPNRCDSSDEGLLSSIDNNNCTGQLRPKTSTVLAPISKISILFASKTTPIDRQLQEGRMADFSIVRKRKPCRATCLFDPAGRLCYYWSMCISAAFVYNLWVISYRFAFNEVVPETYAFWFTCDYLADLLYILDLLLHLRTGFMNNDGVLQTDFTKIRIHYGNSMKFYLDCLSLLPLDVLYLSFGVKSAFRCIRLVKIYKFWAFLDSTERHTNYPMLFRSVYVSHYVLLIFHWNSCVLFGLQSETQLTDLLNFTRNHNSTIAFSNYLTSFAYGCTLLFPGSNAASHLLETAKGNSYALAILIAEQISGTLLFACIFAHVTNIVSHLAHAKKEFQERLDDVKRYMKLRSVPDYLQIKVVRWFDFLWHSRMLGIDEKVLNTLPNRLKAEIAIQVHLDTLKKVEIFRNTEPGFLCELVLRLKPVLFSPGDYVCRRGEVGKEMYIVSRGRLYVITDDGQAVLATLKAGSYFGEISLLNMATEGNRRTASVVSVGYSQLFCLSRKDMVEVLEDYPAARDRLEEIANRRLAEKKLKSCIRPKASSFGETLLLEGDYLSHHFEVSVTPATSSCNQPVEREENKSNQKLLFEPTTPESFI